MFFRQDSGEALAQGCPDAAAGLYIKTRSGQTVRAPIPPGSLAFQIGECAQIQSGGALQATPHWVQAPRGAASEGVGRGTMAVFMCVGATRAARAAPCCCSLCLPCPAQLLLPVWSHHSHAPFPVTRTAARRREPEHAEVLCTPPGADPEEVLRGARGELLPPGVPPLVDRWRETDSFRDFTVRTLGAYY
jgi:hypothetical protein